MSKRMVTYSVSNDDKIASIDGHEVGSGGVGDKSISRRMITYKVDNAGKIASIDGHELGGGGGNYEIKELVVTENGVYDVTGEAYKPVRVNVPQTAQGGSVKSLLDATKSTRGLFKDYKGTSVDGLISYSDTSNVTNMSEMFFVASKLTTIPQLDTSNVRDMSEMFRNCTDLTSVPQLDTSNVTDMESMFYSCGKLTTIPQLNTSKATRMLTMFLGCSKLTTIPQFDTSNVSNMGEMFSGCTSLTSIPELNVSRCTYFSYMLKDCTSLTSIGMYGFRYSIDISQTALEHDALVAFLNQAGTAYGSQTITMGSAKLALLSDEEKAIATNKGWTLA